MKCQTISFLGVGMIFDPVTFITFWANSACDKLVIVLVYPENKDLTLHANSLHWRQFS